MSRLHDVRNQFEIRIQPLPRHETVLNADREPFEIFDVVWEVWTLAYNGDPTRLTTATVKWDAASVWDSGRTTWVPVRDFDRAIVAKAQKRAEAYVELLTLHYKRYVFPNM